MNLRSMIDGVGSLQLNIKEPVLNAKFKLHQDVVLRRQSNRSGPRTNEVIVGKILAMGTGTATISIQKQSGLVERTIVNLRDLSPVTEVFKRNSVQFTQGFRSRA